MGFKCKIFLCYRHQDSSGHARSIADGLRRQFGSDSVFMDDQLRAGNWRESIDEALDACDLLVAVIGRAWLSEFERREGQRAELRYALVAALRRGIFIVPALVDRAEVPDQEAVPADIARVFDSEAYELRDRRDWESDLGMLVTDVVDRLQPRHTDSEPETEASRLEGADRPSARERERQDGLVSQEDAADETIAADYPDEIDIRAEDDAIAPIDTAAMEATDEIRVSSGSTVKDVAEYLGVPVPEVIKKLMTLGEMATLTQTLADDAIQWLADEFDRQIEIVHAADDVEVESVYEDADDVP